MAATFDFREVKQRRRRRLRKRHFLNGEFALIQPLSRLFHLIQFIKCCLFFLELNSKRLYRRSWKEKESRRLVVTSSTKREIRHIHVVVVPWRQRNVQKRRDACAELLFCQPNILLFCRSRWRHRRRCLSLSLRKIGEKGYISPWGKHWREGRRRGEKYISPLLFHWHFGSGNCGIFGAKGSFGWLFNDRKGISISPS